MAKTTKKRNSVEDSSEDESGSENGAQVDLEEITVADLKKKEPKKHPKKRPRKRRRTEDKSSDNDSADASEESRSEAETSDDDQADEVREVASLGRRFVLMKGLWINPDSVAAKLDEKYDERKRSEGAEVQGQLRDLLDILPERYKGKLTYLPQFLEGMSSQRFNTECEAAYVPRDGNPRLALRLWLRSSTHAVTKGEGVNGQEAVWSIVSYWLPPAPPKGRFQMICRSAPPVYIVLIHIASCARTMSRAFLRARHTAAAHVLVFGPWFGVLRLVQGLADAHIRGGASAPSIVVNDARRS
ncbi:hypothetical protein DFH09DRAFT_1313195 [Mycena vulgaris]|nr:hypothetical protein DFH09DRAFT_1313195 [Mycena vulgaris]